MKNKTASRFFPPEMKPLQRPTPCKNKADWNRVLQGVLRDYQKFLRKGERNRISALDINGAMGKRRADVILSSVEDVCRRYEEMQSSMPYENSIGNDWIWLNLPFDTYSHVEADNYLLFAASIWILDRITDWDDQRRALYSLLLRDDRELDDYAWPGVWDCQHDEFLIASVMHLLYERNSNSGAPEFTPEGYRKVLTNSAAAQGGTDPESAGRARYEALLSLLPQEDIQKAVSRFKTLFWAWTDRYYHCTLPLQEAIRQEEAKMDALIAQYNEGRQRFISYAEAVEREFRQAKAGKKAGAKTGSPIVKPPAPSLLENQAPSLTKLSGLSGASTVLSHSMLPTLSPAEQKAAAAAKELDALVDSINEQGDAVAEAQHRLQKFQYTMVRFGRPTHNHLELDFGAEIADRMYDIEIGDPYELCFALLYLIESGDDLPWLYGPGVGLMREVADSLPWTLDPFEEDCDDIWYPDGGYVPESHKPSAIADWDERKYLYNKGRDDDDPRSLAQIVYELTGCLMPRDMHRYDVTQKELSRYGIRGKDAIGLLYSMLALTNARHQNKASNLDAEMQDWIDNGLDTSEDRPVSMNYDELHALSEKRKDEIKTLRAALHEAERSAHSAQKELERLQSEAAAEHRELADLRELLFLQEQPAEETEVAQENGLFPYEVQKDTLIFGGHATWAKAIRPLLTGNIRFLDKDKSFDSAIIRHAEVIWIQTNALSHAQFYGIIDAVRQFKKPVRYFTYASAVKCAMQLAESDQHTDK